MNGIEKRIAFLRTGLDLHLKLGEKMLLAYGGALYPLDILANAVLKRSMALITGFTSLVEQRNYVCAAPLLRLQLDNCIRFYGAFIVKNPHEYAERILKGTPVKKMKDRNDKLMHDAHLVEMMSEKYPWVKRVYKESSGFIHLSDKHIFCTFTEPKEEENSVGICIGATDENMPEKIWEEVIDAFIEATQVLFAHIQGWIITKENPQIVAQYRKDHDITI
ncbi:hypothetical protein [Geobacter pickeringii]|uniref:hypothetical protein n=1 Tax=Geobacter pickeringii TaxID=345632 RepID=UPI00068CF993|nr:hypothetical protein [Geobacter pickeringii]